MLPLIGLLGLIRFCLLGQLSRCFRWSLVLTRLLSSLQKTVLVEGTAHTMYTT